MKNTDPFVRHILHLQSRRNIVNTDFIYMSVQHPLHSPTPFSFFVYLFTQQSTLLCSALAYPFSIANSLILAPYTKVESRGFLFSLSLYHHLLPSLRYCIFSFLVEMVKNCLLLSGIGFTRKIWVGFRGFM